MRHPIRLISASLFIFMTVYHVRLGNAFPAALSAACATYWFMTWIWMMYERD